MKLRFIIGIGVLIASCGGSNPNAGVRPDAPNERVVRDGADGAGCTTVSVEGGVELRCEDGTTTFIRYGTDGVDGRDGRDGIDGQSCDVTETPFELIVTCPTSSVKTPKTPHAQTANLSVYKVTTASVPPNVQFTCIADQQAMRIRTGGSSNFTFEKVGEFSFNDSLTLEPSTEYLVRTVSGGGTFKLTDDDGTDNALTKACTY